MKENCERCGERHASYRRIWMENELEHKMYYTTILLCEKCAWALRDKVRDAVKDFMDSSNWNALHDHQPTPGEVKELDERVSPKKTP
jgi:hypothetical protein